MLEGINKTYSEEGKLEIEGEIKNGKLNGKVKITKNGSEFDGEYLDNFEWKGKIRENNPNCIVEGEYKNYKFSGKVKRKNKNGEFKYIFKREIMDWSKSKKI